MEKDGLSEAIFFIVTALGLVTFGSAVLWMIFGVVVLSVGPENVDVSLIMIFALLDLVIFIIGLAYFLLGVQRGAVVIFNRDNTDEKEDPDLKDDPMKEKYRKRPDKLSIHCKKCNGTGKCTVCKVKGACNKCAGVGMVKVFGEMRKCKDCKGSGECPNCHGEKTCFACGGTGKIPHEKRPMKSK